MTTTRPDLETTSLIDHRRLEAKFDELLAAAAAGVDKRTLVELWGAFERGLTAHIASEEEHEIPRFLATHPEECEAIQLHHRRFAELLTEVGVLVDLGMVREPAVQDLVDTLRAHAALEERTLYRWGRPEAAPPLPGSELVVGVREL